VKCSKEDLIGLIPAAGMGSRLGLPFPKELYPIVNGKKYKPVSQYIFDQILQAGVDHIVFVVNEQKHQLMQYFGNGHRFNCNISYVVQEGLRDQHSRSVTPGLAEAMDAAYHLVKDKIVVFGMPDTIISPDHIFKAALQAMDESHDLLLCLFKTDKPEKSGMVRLGPEETTVLEIKDKPAKTELEWMWGSIIWRPSFNEFLHEAVTNQGIYDYGTIFNAALKSGLKFGGAKFEQGAYLDIGTFDDVAMLGKFKNN